MKIAVQIDKGQTELAAKGLPAEGWHLAEVLRVEPVKIGNYFRLVFLIIAGPSEGLQVSEVIAPARAGESQDMVLRRIRFLQVLQLVDDAAEGSLEIDLEQAVGRRVEIDVVHVKENARTYANLSFVGIRSAS